MRIERTTYDDPVFRKLVADLDRDLETRYEDQHKYTPFNVLPPDVSVVLAYADNVAVACGCFRPTKEKSTVEIKRMYTIPAWRSRGYARAILVELEQWALATNHSMAILETGVNQPEAIAAYTKAGYERIENYGPYVDNGKSICMRKLLR